MVIDNAPWMGLQRSGGMAVDSQNRVYLEDTQDVWIIEGQNVSKYLTLDEAAAKNPVTVQNYITDLDIGPDGLLYIALSGFSDTAAVTVIVRSSGPHVAQPWLDVSSIGAARLSVISANRAAVVNVGGLYTLSATGPTLVYPNDQLENRENCALQDLSATPTGAFLYQPGCNGSALFRGNVDGSGVSTVTGFYVTYICTARDPRGGFYMAVDDFPPGAFRIYHFADGATAAADATLVETTPPFGQVQGLQADPLDFVFCSMAAATDGSIYVQTFSQLWKVSP